MKMGVGLRGLWVGSWALLLLLLLLTPEVLCQPATVSGTLKTMRMNTFNDALAATNFAGQLQSPGFVGTVFVPTEQAWADFFAKYGTTLSGLLERKDFLTKLLSYHVVPSLPVPTQHLRHSARLATKVGQNLLVDLRAKPGAIIIRGFDSAATIKKKNIIVSSKMSIIHTIDRVLLPDLGFIPGCKSVVQVASSLGRLGFIQLLQNAGKTGQALLSPSFVGTVFIPEDKDIASVSAADAEAVVNNHIVTGAVLPGPRVLQGLKLTTRAGKQVTVQRAAAMGPFTLVGKGARVRANSYYRACRATVHLINNPMPGSGIARRGLAG